MIIDDVRGRVIGSYTYPYQFWTTKPGGYPCYLKVHCFARGHFENDAEAEAYAKEHYPEQYSQGVEMRVYEGG